MCVEAGLGMGRAEANRSSSLVNQIQGAIPDSICQASSLERLILSGNFLNGTIASCISNNLTRMTQLDLSRNDLTGPVTPLTLPKLEVVRMVMVLLIDPS